MPPNHVAGFVVSIAGLAREPFLLIAPNAGSASPMEIASLTALALLAAQTSLLQPTLMPTRMAFAILKCDGTIQHQLGRKLPQWAVAEHQRFLSVLVTQHRLLVDQMHASLRDPSASPFRPVSADFPMPSSPGQVLEFEPPTIPVDTSGWARVYGSLDRDQVVRIDYDRDRYMRHLSDAQILQRGHDIMANIYELDEAGRVTLQPVVRLRNYWLERLVEVDHERILRGITDGVFAKAVMEKFPYPAGSDLPVRLAELVNQVKPLEAQGLVRYGKREHILQAYESGRFLLSPGSKYADPSLDPSRKDDELRVSLDVDTTFLRLFGPGAKRVGKRLSVNSEQRSNFYVLCTSASLRARLFLDFVANACLVVREPSVFRDRLYSAIRRVLPDYRTEARRVKYYDPLNVSPAEILVPIWKHFRFAYQEEVRFVADPPTPVPRLEPVFISLGSLHDIAEVHSLD